MKPHHIALSVIVSVALFSSGALAASLFRDVPVHHWAADAVEHVATEGIMTGPGDRPNSFDPAGTVNRAELATVASRLLARIEALEYAEGYPEYSLAEARDAQRRSDVNTILNAIYQYAIDNNGNLPPGITSTFKEVCKSGATNCIGLLNLKILEKAYVVHVPSDPLADDNSRSSGYRVRQSSSMRITVDAPLAEGDQAISVTR